MPYLKAIHSTPFLSKGKKKRRKAKSRRTLFLPLKEKRKKKKKRAVISLIHSSSSLAFRTSRARISQACMYVHMYNVKENNHPFTSPEVPKASTYTPPKTSPHRNKQDNLSVQLAASTLKDVTHSYRHPHPCRLRPFFCCRGERCWVPTTRADEATCIWASGYGDVWCSSSINVVLALIWYEGALGL